MGVTRTEYYFQLVGTRTKRPIDDDSGTFSVCTAGSPAEATIYSSREATSAGSNPATLTNGVGQFWTDDSVTSVDIHGITSTGIPFTIEGLTPSQHRVDINTEQYTGMVMTLPFDFSTTGSTSFHDTGHDLSTDNIVNPDIRVVITTAGVDGSDFFQLGTSTDASAWLAGVKASSTGTKLAIHSTDLSHAVTATFTAIQLGTALLLSVTAQDDFTPVQIANATSGARLKYKDVSGTAATTAGYVYIELDRVVV